MTWQSRIMPDDALSNSLVGTMLQLGETGEITGDGSGEALPEIDGPLWKVLSVAYDQSLPTNGGWRDQDGYAAEIEALRDWLLPNAARWYPHRDLYAILTEQARIARGERQAEAAPAPVAEPNFRALCAELLEGIETDCIDWNDRERFQSLIDRARAELEAQPATPAPVPVAERLPDVGDCLIQPTGPDEDLERWCWFFRPGLDGVSEWRWNTTPRLTEWYGWQGITHWLPYWALPLPEAQP
jgi:hypothetical protein